MSPKHSCILKFLSDEIHNREPACLMGKALFKGTAQDTPRKPKKQLSSGECLLPSTQLFWGLSTNPIQRDCSPLQQDLGQGDDEP